MKISKGQRLIVRDSRKGKYKGIATKDFDTEADEWYGVAAQEIVYGMANVWDIGEKVPCRRGQATIAIDESAEQEARP